MKNSYGVELSQSDVKILIMAQELPALEAAYREKFAEMKQLSSQVRQATGRQDREAIGTFGFLYRMGMEVLRRQKRDFDHAYECAKYVEEVINKKKGEGDE